MAPPIALGFCEAKRQSWICGPLEILSATGGLASATASLESYTDPSKTNEGALALAQLGAPALITQDEGLPATNTETLQLRPHPCTLPRPESPGITCTTRTFLVDYLPPTYPYMHYRSASSPNPKFQIHFFVFSGPDPPPSDIGATPGDVYVAPAASALYAYLPAGGWTRWTAVAPDAQARRSTLRLEDAGLLAHPHFPDRMLWPSDSTFTWYSINNSRARRNKGVGAEVLVARTLQHGHEAKRRAEDGQGTKTRKRPCRSVDAEEEQVDAEVEQPNPQAEAPSLQVEKVDQRIPGEKETGAVSREASTTAEWDTFYAKPRNAGNTRAGKQLREQAAVIARWEAENTALRTRIAALESQLESTTTAQEPERVAAKRAESMAAVLDPEVMEFMRETFAREVVKTCYAQQDEAQAAAAKAKAQVVILEKYLDDAMKVDDVVDPELHAEAQRARAAEEKTQLAAKLARAIEQDADARDHASLYIREAQEKIAQLGAKLQSRTDAEAASLHRSTAEIAEAQRKIAKLEAEAARLEACAQKQTDALHQLLAAREDGQDDDRCS
ncbi:hypothetical protein B0H17DRAFT_1211664 [Mycena rosella]|uniref:Uncharacterized protein n=1 Tax=Mycena rosella TaxID=1033263 RepID=A0AAD7G644_MYCRO|nr:hypothetical protein B0H17DRAFT_1211664 [Mycena rosella]